MIKGFQDFLNEAFRDRDAVNITSAAAAPICIYLDNTEAKDVKGYLADGFRGTDVPVWFFLHKGININREPSDKEVVLKLKAAFDSWTSFYAVNASEGTASTIITQGADTMKVLLDHPTFSKWWKESLDKYKGTIMGNKYGL